MVGLVVRRAGNIRRSPTAKGKFPAGTGQAGLLGRLDVDAAATQGCHVGRPPDPHCGTADDFERPFDVVEPAGAAVFEHFRRTHFADRPE
jgi:hypothetical protein